MEMKPDEEHAARTTLRRPLSVTVVQCVIGMFCVTLLLGALRPPLRAGNFVLMAVVVALVLLVVALARRRPFARWIAIAIVVVCLGAVLFSPANRATWSAYLGGAASTHLAPPYMNLVNRQQLFGAVLANVVLGLLFGWLVFALAFSRRARAWFAPQATPPRNEEAGAQGAGLP